MFRRGTAALGCRVAIAGMVMSESVRTKSDSWLDQAARIDKNALAIPHLRTCEAIP